MNARLPAGSHVKNRLLIVGALWLGAVTGVFPQSAGSGATNPAAPPVSAPRDVIATYCRRAITSVSRPPG